MADDLSPAERIERSEATAHDHHRRTGHELIWTMGLGWACDDCDETYPPRESGADR